MDEYVAASSSHFKNGETGNVGGIDDVHTYMVDVGKEDKVVVGEEDMGREEVVNYADVFCKVILDDMGDDVATYLVDSTDDEDGWRYSRGRSE